MTWLPDMWTGPEQIRHGKHTHAYYLTGPPDAPRVLLLHEFPGISGNLVALADHLASTYRVIVPSIVGRDGHPTVGDTFVKLCIRREVRLLLRGSPAVAWLRALVDEVVAPMASTRPFGVIGLCMTGNFALALAVDARVRAAVVAEPAIPIWPSALGLSAADRTALEQRTDLCVRGYRFENDWLSPVAKLTAAEKLLGDAMVVVPLPKPARGRHSTLTGVSASKDALDQVMAFLAVRLAD